MPKILYFVTEDHFFYSHRLPIARAAKKAGYEIIVVTRITQFQEKIEAEGFKVIPINLIRSSLNPLKEIKIIYKLINILNTHKPNIIHNIAIKPIVYGTIAANFAKIPTIVNAFTGLGHIYTSDTYKAKLLRAFITKMLKRLFSNKKVQGIVQNSEDRNFFVKEKIISNTQLTLIPGSGVNINHFTPAPEPSGKIVVTYIGRILWDKGIRELVSAAQLILKQRSDIIFRLIGETDPHNPSSVPLSNLKQWEQQGIEWLGYQENVVDWIHHSHMIVLPSYREGLPKVLLEANACAKPVITTDAPGCYELVTHEINGLIVSKKDVQSLQKAILKLADNADLRKQYGQAGREIVEKKYQEEYIVQQTLSLYHAIQNNSSNNTILSKSSILP